MESIVGCSIEGVAHESDRATIYRGRQEGRIVAIKVRKRGSRGPLPDTSIAAYPPGRPVIHAQYRDERDRVVTVMEWLDGHRLIDELAERMALDVGRVGGVLERLRQSLHQQHPALRTDQIFMAAGDAPVLTGRDTPPLEDVPLDAYAAPELLQTGAVTMATNAYALGVIAYELLTGRPPFASPGEAIERAGQPPPMHPRRPGLAAIESRLVECLRIEPAMRPLVQLQGFPIPSVLTGRKRGHPAVDASEASLLDALRSNPRDVATRQVYADWLEQHGFDLRAERLRVEDDLVERGGDPGVEFERQDPEGAGWRAIASRARIDRCDGVAFSYACPKRWDALDTTAFDDVRFCKACEKPVYFVTSVEEAHARGARLECVAIDSALVKRDALSRYDAGVPRPIAPLPWDGEMGHVTMGAVAPNPVPRLPRKPSLWQRLFGRRQ